MTTLQDLTSLDGRQLARWLVAQPATSLAELREGELLAVVELLTSRLTDESEVFSVDDWRAGSEAVDQVLATAEAAGSIDRNESAIRRLNLSAALLRPASPQDDIPILNIDRICAFFAEAVPMSAEQARDLASDWRGRDVAVIRQLRFAKNLVTPMLLVRDFVSDDYIAAELNAWEEVLPLLP
jgi:hypothetical protein